ncbi:hypothetical protein ACHAWF_011846 [Thalassiosira exigua]
MRRTKKNSDNYSDSISALSDGVDKHLDDGDGYRTKEGGGATAQEQEQDVIEESPSAEEVDAATTDQMKRAHEIIMEELDGGYDDDPDDPEQLAHEPHPGDDNVSKLDYGDGVSAWEDGEKGQDDNYDGEDELEDQKLESLCVDCNCCFVPTRAEGWKETLARTASWSLANADQFISAIIVSISLIPESISYALIAGLPPSAALQSGWIANLVTASVGGRPGMISGASGLVALLLYRLANTDTVSESPGIMYVPYAVGFAGVLQCVSAGFGLGKLVSTFPAPMVVGMVNALAILVLLLQCRYAKEFPQTNSWFDVEGTAPAAEVSFRPPVMAYFGEGLPWISPTMPLGIFYAEAIGAFLICMFLPKLTTFLPATLVSVLVIVAAEFGLARQLGVQTPLIGDYGGAQVQYPWQTVFSSDFELPSLASWETWKLLLGYGFAIFATQFTETAIALNVVDRLDESQGPGYRVLIGQGLSNIISGIFRGMGGSGIVSLSVLADRTFGTTCLSTFLTGIISFFFVAWAYPVVDYIPLSAVSGISVAMVASFIQWRSMVASFAACLPSAKRDLLPPQYNIARFDVLIMVFVTFACLIVDVATMAFFVFGLFTFLFLTTVACCRKCRERMQGESDYEEEEVGGEGSYAEGSQNELVDVEAGNEEGGPEDGDATYDEHAKEFQNGEKGGCNTWDCNMMESAERAIFPEKGRDTAVKRQRSELS